MAFRGQRLLLLLVCAEGFRESINRSLGQRNGRAGREDVLAVMNVNAFLLEVRVGGWLPGNGMAFGSKPDMKERADGFVSWFQSLKEEEVPDVVVFNEIFSKAASTVLKRLCSSKWTRGGRGATDKVYQCDVGNFGFATRVANPAGIIKISGGVVIMVRKGLTISDLHEEAYEDHDFEDGMSQKGFLRARVHHPSIGEVWVIGSHTQAWPENEEIRVKQWRQLWRHIQTTIPEGARVVVAGDMNTETSEISVMKTELHAASPPLQQAGFWLPLRETLKYSSYGGGGQNAYLHYDPKEVHEKSPHDQIAYISNDGKYASPQTMKWQYLPMKSDVCFSSSLTRPNISVDDLSDHYAAYAELCYGSRCESQELSGHRGYSRIGFMEAPRCCPGRGLIYGKCFDWAPGGIHAGDIGLSESQRCTKISKKCETKVQASSVEECLRMLAEMDLPFDQIECN